MKYATLTWVKPTIDETLKQINQSLEQFIENPEDPAPLQEATSWLEEVYGVLLTLEIDTAVMLIESMQQVTKALTENQIENKSQAYDSLMQTLVQLPNYLDHLTLGYPDIPLALAPLINKLRALCKQQPIAIKDLFSPDLTAPIPGEKQAPQLADDKLKIFVHKLRAVYQKSLVAWLKQPANVEGLKPLLTVTEKLQQVSGMKPLNKLWWVMSGLLEAVIQKGLPPNKTLVTALKQVDALMKQIVTHGNRGLHITPPANLMQALLQLGLQAKVKGPRMKAVSDTFGLAYYHPESKQLQTARQVFTGPNVELMGNVVKIMKDDFARLEETLDIFQRSDTPDINDLSPLIEIIDNLTHTLDMLGMGVQSTSMQKQKQTIQSMCNGEMPHELPQLLEVANDLLQVNAALDTMANRGIHARQQIQREEGLLETQFKDILVTVVDEAKLELSEITLALKQFIETNEDDQQTENTDEGLQLIPERFSQIQGLLHILSQDRAIKLIDLCTQYISQVLVEQSQVPEEVRCQALADAILSLELYLDTLAGNPLDSNRILDTTQRCLNTLRA
ncbi:MAG: hypothetical protein AAF512_09990 [Pseudomonadota bacterium]